MLQTLAMAFGGFGWDDFGRWKFGEEKRGRKKYPGFTRGQEILANTNGDTISAVDNLSISVVPEPGTFALLAPVGLAFLIRRRR